MTTRSKSNRFNPGGRATSLQHVLKKSSSVTSPHLSTCQFFNTLEAMRTNSTLSITSYVINGILENLSYSETVIENPKEKDPAKVITRVERYPRA